MVLGGYKKKKLKHCKVLVSWKNYLKFIFLLHIPEGIVRVKYIKSNLY